MFYVIGLGLSDEKDITLRGLEVCHDVAYGPSGNSVTCSDPAMQAIKGSTRVYLEAYTSILLIEKERLVCELS